MTSLCPLGAALSGSWRCNSPGLDHRSYVLGDIVELAVASRTAPLIWGQVSKSGSHFDHQSGLQLKRFYQDAVAQSFVQDDSLALLVSVLNCSGLKPLIFKGWAARQFYCHPFMRSFGDFDLCFPDHDLQKAKENLSELAVAVNWTPDGADYAVRLAGDESRLVHVDLHFTMQKYELDKSAFDRAQEVELRDAKFLVPCHEHQLRIAALHFLKDGGWRPISLCDVAAIIESVTEGFDWDLCMGSDPTISNWVATTIGLADELLGADTDAVPIKYRKKTIPNWMLENIKRSWQGPFVSPYSGPPFSQVWRKPKRFWREVRKRWPNAIIATVSLKLPFDDSPRWPIQARWFVTKAFHFLRLSFSNFRSVLMGG